MDYLKCYQKMISLRGLTDHTMKSYQTYICAYLTFISDTLHKAPSQVTYKEQRQFLEKLQKERKINVAISQLRFFTLYVLHKPWDDTQLSYFLHRMIFSQFSGNPISLSNCSRVRCGHCLRTLLMSLVKPDLNALKSSSLIR